MSMLGFKRKILILLGFLFYTATACADNDLILSHVPTDDPEVAKKQMQPLANYLSKATGRKIQVVVAKNFIEYGEHLLQDKYDLSYGGPHFIGWQVQKHKHRAIAKIPGDLKFVVIVADNSEITAVQQFVGKRVCGLVSPNGMTLGFIDLFPNAAAVPSIIPVKKFEDGLDCIKNGDGIAAVMRNTAWNKMTPQSKQGFKLMHISEKGLPNLGFSVGKRVDAQTAEKLRAALLSDEAKRSAGKTFSDLKIDKFIPTSSEEYEPFGRLLRPIWGFHE